MKSYLKAQNGAKTVPDFIRDGQIICKGTYVTVSAMRIFWGEKYDTYQVTTFEIRRGCR